MSNHSVLPAAEASLVEITNRLDSERFTPFGTLSAVVYLAQPLFTPAVRLTISFAAKTARTPVCVNGTEPKSMEREKFAFEGLQITSVPCRVVNLPAMTVSAPVAYWA